MHHNLIFPRENYIRKSAFISYFWGIFLLHKLEVKSEKAWINDMLKLFNGFLNYLTDRKTQKQFKVELQIHFVVKTNKYL